MNHASSYKILWLRKHGRVEFNFGSLFSGSDEHNGSVWRIILAVHIVSTFPLDNLLVSKNRVSKVNSLRSISAGRNCVSINPVDC